MTNKPCPFCGSAKSRIEQYDGDVWRTCCKCECATKPCNNGRDATKVWNDRRHWIDRKAAGGGDGDV